MRQLLPLIALAAAAVLLGGCHYAHQSYGFSYHSGYSPAYYHCDPVIVYDHHHHHHWRSHHGWRHGCH